MYHRILSIKKLSGYDIKQKKGINIISLKRYYLNKVNFREHLKPLILRIHPDLFQEHPSIRLENEESLKKMNSFIDMVESYSDKTTIQLEEGRVQTVTHLSFFLKNKTKNDVELGSFKNIRATCSLPQDYFRKPVPYKRLEADCCIFINQLLKQAQLPTIPINFDYNEMSSNNLYDKFGENIDIEGDKKLDDERTSYFDVLAKSLNRYYPKSQLAYDKTGGTPNKYLSELAMGMRAIKKYTHVNKFINYVKHLDGRKRGEGLLLIQKLWDNKIIPDDIPILITDEGEFFDPYVLPAVLTIPYCAKKDELEKYLTANLNTIIIQRDDMKKKMFDTEFLFKQWKELLNLFSFEVDNSISLDESYECLMKLEKVKMDILSNRIYDGMIWKITKDDDFKIDILEHTLYIPYNKKGKDLIDFIDKNKNLFKLRYNLYPSESFRNDIIKALNRLCKIIETKEIRISPSLLTKTQYQILSLKTLFNNINHLRSYKLKHFIITISDHFGFNPKEKELILPYIFESNELIDFMEGKRNKR